MFKRSSLSEEMRTLPFFLEIKGSILKYLHSMKLANIRVAHIIELKLYLFLFNWLIELNHGVYSTLVSKNIHSIFLFTLSFIWSVLCYYIITGLFVNSLHIPGL